ncbi:MAG: hypothetical protein L6R36_005577 [Xanthoria steineri]|nr:MAG: hypothetical protein L6R36_005577 [Xanthoria steineri]
MARPTGQKRQAAQADIDSADAPRRTRSKVTEDANYNKRRTRSSDQSPTSASAKKLTSPKTPPSAKKKIVKKGTAGPVKKNAKKLNVNTSSSSSDQPAATNDSRRRSFSKVVISSGGNRNDGEASNHETEEESPDGPSYWLMKAEPDSRIEKGKDVKFSIDDLKKASEPEAWDGVRNAAARNHMRSMLQDDMAFFYHSNCKTPGIVGTMEVVREHSVDESAFDKEHPYYDEKSTRDKPKWCVVHVEFRSKFEDPVTLKELQKYAKPGGILENMQTLKMSRLSVSKVSKKEWDFIHTLTGPDAIGAPPTKSAING